MQIDDEIIEELIEDAGQERTKKAKRYQIQGKVELTYTNYENRRNFDVKAKVYGNETYKTYISVQDGIIEDVTCTCPDYENYYGTCKHSLATIFELERANIDEILKINNKQTKNLNSDIKYRNFRQIVNNIYNEEIETIENEKTNKKNEYEKIKIEPKIIKDPFDQKMLIEFKIGRKRMYKLKNLSEFYERMLSKSFYKYGDKLEFLHEKEAFEDESQEMLEFILKYSEIIKYANSNTTYGYYGKQLSETSIAISNTGIDDLFEILKGKKCKFKERYDEKYLEFIDEDPRLELELEKKENDYMIRPNIEVFKLDKIIGRKHKYLIYENKIYRLTKKFEKTKLKIVETFKENYVNELELQEKDLSDFFSIIMPKVNNDVKLVNIEEEKIEKYKPKKLGVKIYLDFDENNYITADIKFCYDKIEFNPLDETEKIEIPRDKIEENKSLNIFKNTGFMYDIENQRFILPEEEKIYNFLTNDISFYMQKFEVMVTDKFKTKQIITPKLGEIGVKVENDLLKIDFSKIDFNIKELQEIMQKYKLKKKYHRLKDGTFINLEENKEIDFFDKLTTGMDIKYNDFEDGEIKLPVNRTLYLNQLLKGIKGTQITKNQEYRKIVNNLNQETSEEEYEIPKQLNANLRYYQKTGYNWLKTLDNYKFGGILADDMGLGKTIQLLAIILEYIENSKKQKEKRKTSIVISPSSLTLNWLNEAQKFAPSLNVTVISGKASQRKEIIENIDDYDLVITSYDLVKRDIETYKKANYTFRFAITDEAQYLKNSTTQNAKSVKILNAQTKFALTGTPIENSLAELWSIFDFVMPGYLFTYKHFKTTYETPIVKEKDEKTMKKLQMLIQPFVLRRTKKEVLTELPEKTITVLNNEMEEEQKNIYLSYLMQAKQDVEEEIGTKGFNGSQIKILAALTRLRQICCHPGLFLENYKGPSSKLHQCVEIVEDAVESGHKILIFSTYTSMFDFLEEKLNERKIKYFKLTGSTKVSQRIEMVDDFNENEEIKVFLISLKAGGTGLNLTGADMVIHYDPWWNLSAENQATDRAYRIGQKNNVQVYKLITKNTIEEKIYELQKRKAKLADDMLSTKTTFVSKLSKDEIMNLFS